MRTKSFVGSSSKRAIRFFLRSTSTLGGLALVVFTLAIVVSCDMNFVEEDEGTLEVSVGSVDTMSFLPDQDMEVASYQLEGDGPGDAGFTETISGGTSVIEGLETGTWLVNVTGQNAPGVDIAAGSGQTDIVAGETVELGVTVTPYEGPGTLSVSVSWPEADVSTPQVSGELVASDGASQALSFDLGGSGTATGEDTSVAAGYYTVTVQVLDGSTVVAGAAESARVAQDARTSGNFSFEEINPPTGDADIVIDPELDDPLEVTINGALDSIAMGDSMSVSAEVSNADGETVSYSWYINGGFLSTGESTTLGSSLDPGSYRLDVVANTSDGDRSGSASHTFTVTE